MQVMVKTLQFPPKNIYNTFNSLQGFRVIKVDTKLEIKSFDETIDAKKLDYQI